MNNKFKTQEKAEKQAVVTSSGFIRGKKKLPKGKYKNVYAYEFEDGSVQYQGFIPKYKWSAYFETEKQAGIAVDKLLISKGKSPVNVLKAL